MYLGKKRVSYYELKTPAPGLSEYNEGSVSCSTWNNQNLKVFYFKSK